MAYFNHAFKKVFVGTHATEVEAPAQPGPLTQAGITEGFVTSIYTAVGGAVRLKTSDLQSYGMGPGSFAFFDPKTYEIKDVSDLSGLGCCPLILASASIRTNDKIGPFHGGYQESNKSKIINPRYVNKLYRVDPCVPQQAVVSIGTTPYTSQTVGAVATLDVAGLPAGTGYAAGTYAVSGGTGNGATVIITVNAGVVQTATLVEPGAGYTVGDVLTIVNGDSLATVDVATITPAISADATCCKSFLCGETYYLRIDVKGSPTLRALNHNAYQTVDAYGGCCSCPVPDVIDPTLIYLQWAKKIVENNYLKDFVMPVVFDYTGVAWYAPGTTVTLDGTLTPVTPAQWWTSAAGVDQYAASVQGLAWVVDLVPSPDSNCAAGMRLYGSFVSTNFLDCTFQTTDHFEKEPVKILASLVDYTGDPCTFEGLCVYQECAGVQGMGFGETVIRDLILSESYLQNFFHKDLRIREITGGLDSFIINRTAQYYRYCLLHSVPRFNNPSGMFDNDQYLLEVITEAVSAPFETFLSTWLGNCDGCVALEIEDCTPCVIGPDAALVIPN